VLSQRIRAATPQSGGNQAFIVLAHQSSPFVTAYFWDDTTGFGSKLSDPATLPVSSLFTASFSPDMDAVFFTPSTALARVYAYEWSSTGFGAQYSDPTLRHASATNVEAASDVVFLNHSVSPRISATAWDSVTGFGSLYSDPPSPLPVSGRATVKLINGGNVVCTGGSGSPPSDTWRWDSTTGFGTKYSPPASFPLLAIQSVTENSSSVSKVVMFGINGSPRAVAYPFTYASGFGAKFANPSTSIGADDVEDAVFTENDEAVIFSVDGGDRLIAYEWDNTSGFGARYAAPAVLPAAIGRKIKMNSAKNVVFISSLPSPGIDAYRWDNTTGFGVKFSAPASPPASNIYTILYGEIV